MQQQKDENRQTPSLEGPESIENQSINMEPENLVPFKPGFSERKWADPESPWKDP